MEDKYFYSGVASHLKSIRACVVMLPTLQSLGLKMKQGGDNIMRRQMIYFYFINQSYKKNFNFAKRQTITVLIILKEKTVKILQWK